MLFVIISVCKGGGYRYCRTDPQHPKANEKGLYPLHRVLAENKLGRLLEANEVVHHIDENKDNNDPENLNVMTNANHSRLHQFKGESVACVCACGKEFRLAPSVFRRRSKVARSEMIHCSRRCSGRYAVSKV
jgi:hypothetical protein